MAQILDTPVVESEMDVRAETSRRPAVEIKNMVKTFGKNKVVNNLSLNIERGTVYGLIGPNGAGKSTTLKTLMRMLDFDSGDISILGHDVRSDFQSVKNRIGFVPEVESVAFGSTAEHVSAGTEQESSPTFKRNVGEAGFVTGDQPRTRFVVVGRTAQWSRSDRSRRIPRRSVESYLRTGNDSRFLQPFNGRRSANFAATVRGSSIKIFVRSCHG